MHAFHTTLVNLRVADSSSLDITSYAYGFGKTKMPAYRGGPPIMFLGRGFNKFLVQLLLTFYPALGFRVKGLGFRVWGLGYRVEGLGSSKKIHS
jgi:hypothetical protein